MAFFLGRKYWLGLWKVQPHKVWEKLRIPIIIYRFIIQIKFVIEYFVWVSRIEEAKDNKVTLGKPTQRHHSQHSHETPHTINLSHPVCFEVIFQPSLTVPSLLHFTHHVAWTTPVLLKYLNLCLLLALVLDMTNSPWSSGHWNTMETTF